MPYTRVFAVSDVPTETDEVSVFAELSFAVFEGEAHAPKSSVAAKAIESDFICFFMYVKTPLYIYG